MAELTADRDGAAGAGQALRVAVVTPYFRTCEAWLQQCHDSVRAQTHPCTHVLVADGEPTAQVAGFDALHLVLPRNIGDYGDTPRALGSIYAAGLGFDAVAYLDADNWFMPWHIESLVSLHQRTGAAVCTSGRTLHGTDGTCLGVDPEVDGERFVDTSCLFLTRDAYDVFPVWSSMSPQLHAIDDRVVWAEVLDRSLSRAHTGMPSAAYRTAFAFHYRRFGHAVPPDAKTGEEVEATMRLVVDDRRRQQQAAQRARGPQRTGRVWRYRVTLPRAEEKLASSMALLPEEAQPDRRDLPDFLCIGAQKAGTTWLYRNLLPHPEVYFPEPTPDEPAYFGKESHFFDIDERFARGLDFYARRFAPGRDRTKGDMTPNYALLPPERIRHVHRLMPDARLIYLLRDPVQRAWSRVVMRVVNEHGRDFDSVSDDELYAECVREDVRLNSSYLLVIRNWLRYFPGEQLWIGFLDDIRTQPEPVLREVLAHLGVDAELDLAGFPLAERSYAGPGLAMRPALQRFLHGMYAEQIERLYETFGERVAHWRILEPAAGDGAAD